MNMKRIIELETLAGKLSAWTMEWDDCHDGASVAVRGIADSIMGVASLLRDALDAVGEVPDGPSNG